jgi:hypothetical protein
MIGEGLHFLLDANYYTVSRHRINVPSMWPSFPLP